MFHGHETLKTSNSNLLTANNLDKLENNLLEKKNTAVDMASLSRQLEDE